MAKKKTSRARGRGRAGDRSHRRSVCPIACALDVIGDRWTLLLIRDMAAGRTQYKEFAASPEGIATNILADRLARLKEHELVETCPAPSGRDAYRLSTKGMSLLPVLRELAEWGLKNFPGTRAFMRPTIDLPA